jgi:predicted nuclease of predicted toxin-antitoxin system
VRLLIDEMYSPAIADQLRARGHDATAVHDVPGLSGLADAALLQWAHDQERALITENVVDFLALHAMWLRSGERHSGIILASNAGYPRARASTVGALIKALDQLLLEVDFLDTDVRWLP